MPHVALVALKDCYLSSLTGLMDLLQVANAHARKQLGDRVEPFSWRVVSPEGGSVNVSGGLSIAAEPLTETTEVFDLIYLPGIYYPSQQAFSQYLTGYRQLYDWLRQQHQQKSLIAANCTGTFLVAEAGLLDGHQATTTWWLERQFRTRYPKVALDIRQMLTEDRGLLCAGAITTHQQLALRMVERFFGPSIASLCAKALLVDFGHHPQQPYQVLDATDEHNDAMVAKAQYLMQKTLSTTQPLNQLAAQLNVSPRTLIRRFKAAIGIQPSIYLQNLRLEAAKQLLENTPIPIEEVVLEVGYADPSSFSRLFQRRVGLTPSAYREKFRGTKPHA